ncbi:MAG: hypothetical protein M1831_000490 [Alyxoria varia]|nr:MAG: hypothetical protein M1831_000490 [Alyxoria varia]
MTEDETKELAELLEGPCTIRQGFESRESRWQNNSFRGYSWNVVHIPPRADYDLYNDKFGWFENFQFRFFRCDFDERYPDSTVTLFEAEDEDERYRWIEEYHVAPGKSIRLPSLVDLVHVEPEL